jgi:general secretion pathway protein I
MRVIARSEATKQYRGRARWPGLRRRRCAAPCNDVAGFTLVEIIVALAILALSLNVILPTISDGLWRTSEAEAQAEAASLARSLLAQAGISVPLQNGEAAGRFDNGFRWRLEVTPYGRIDQTMPVRAYKVVAEVFWDDPRHERSIALTTLRLGANGAGR